MIVTLAGPGAGKTTDLVQQVEKVLQSIDSNRELAIITYTNASAKDLREKIVSKNIVPNNVFIGTIHSFLFRYYIKPFAQISGYKTSNTVIVDKFSDTGVEWIEAWTKKNIFDYNMQKIRSKSLLQGTRNKQINAAAQKGIYTFDGIIKISQELGKNKKVSMAVSNRIQYLFVDEYQDIDKYGHNIIKELYKQKKTEISIVGDPDQSIYRFRYGNSQIGEKAPKAGEQPLREFIELSKIKDDIELKELKQNHRSSEEIVNFNNRYGTLSDQVPKNGSVCPVQFIDTCDGETLKQNMFSIGEKYGCESYYAISKKSNTLSFLTDHLDIKKRNIQDELDIGAITDIFISASGFSKSDFIENYELDRFQVRRIAIAVRKALINEEIIESEIANYSKEIAERLYNKNIILRDAEELDSTGKRIKYGFSYNVTNKDEVYTDSIKCMTIHKSKGLEADAVLVIAETKNEMVKWLNMTKANMKSDTDEDYRLGYVAFTRPKKVLMLACKEKMDFTVIKEQNSFEIVQC